MSSTGINKLDRILRNLDELPEQIFTFVGESLEDNKEYVEDLIGLQHEAGITGTGARITPEYTPYTVAQKKAKGQPSDRVTLKDEGDYRDSITQEVERDRAVIFATDEKAEALSDKYGPEILDFTDESKKEIRGQILPDLITKTKKHVLNG